MKKTMTVLAMTGLATLIMGTSSQPAAAASNDECGIWLCLPGGFGSGCSGPKREFIKRITHRPKPKPPLPPYMSCSGGKGSGSYEQGYESHEPCRAGFTTQDHYGDRYQFSGGTNRWNSAESRQCVNLNNCYHTGSGDNSSYVCERYNANRRAKPYFVRITVDGKTYDKYFYKF